MTRFRCSHRQKLGRCLSPPLDVFRRSTTLSWQEEPLALEINISKISHRLPLLVAPRGFQRLPCSIDFRPKSLILERTSVPSREEICLNSSFPSSWSSTTRRKACRVLNAVMATAVGVGSLAPVVAVRATQSRNGGWGTSHAAPLASSRSGFRGRSSSCSSAARSPTSVQRQVVRAMAQDLAQQIKEMAAAEKRWESQVKEGKVKSLSAKEAGYAVDLSGYTLLDVRPSYEHKKAYVKNSVWIPIFDVNKSMDPGTILSKVSNFAMGGWWSGSPLVKYNERFMPDVVAKIPKSANVILACQKGLRSLAACEQLYKAGYRNLYWLNGGFDSAQEGDLEREGAEPFKFAGLGGVSEFLGWTDVQREAIAKEGIGYRIMLFGRLMSVVLAADLLFLGGQQLMRVLHDMRH